jgi:hypothetical protein
LVLIERQGWASGSLRVLCRCDCGNEKRLSLSNLANGRTVNCADRSRHPDPRSRDALTYSGAHSRVRLAKGKASAHRCPCGRPAEQWAYSHADYDEAHDDEGKDAGRPFSADPAHYLALCRSCHARWDRARRALPAGVLSLAHVARWLRATSAEE